MDRYDRARNGLGLIKFIYFLIIIFKYKNIKTIIKKKNSNFLPFYIFVFFLSIKSIILAKKKIEYTGHIQ